ncbi:DUF2330 domain-containing protein [bacterium]|nr:DUF2330 domain-containing protein [bacterium]
MKKYLLGAAVISGTSWWLSLPGQSCCAIPRLDRVSNQPPSIHLDKQSAFLWQTGDKEHMLLSVIYSGGTNEFAWVIPVESRPEVKVEKGAPFTELRRLTEIQKGEMLTARAPGAAAGAPERGVTVLERREEGPYDLALLSATSSGGLYEWLKQNDFQLTKNARGHLDYYVQRKFIFVAARIRNGAKDNATIAERLRSGTIAPMHLTFKAKQLSYPLKVTAANPGPSEMELYVAGSVEAYKPRTGKDPFSGPALKQETFQLKPGQGNEFTVTGPPGTSPVGDFPTLRRLLPKGGALHKFTAVLKDEQRQEDLVFANISTQRNVSAATVKVGGAVPQVGKTELPST